MTALRRAVRILRYVNEPFRLASRKALMSRCDGRLAKVARIVAITPSKLVFTAAFVNRSIV